MDHDLRFKTLIREFFAEFLRLFFADWAERLALDSVEWLDKEVLTDPPEGRRQLLDLVAKVHTKQRVAELHPEEPEQWLALIHIEIEAPDRTARLKLRLPSYYIHLRDKYGWPVLPIVLYLKVGLEGIGIDSYEEHFWELRALSFDYLYVGLPGLDAIQYVQGENWLGVALAALMRIPADQAAWLGAEALRRIAEAPLTDQKRFLLGECLQAYLPLNEQQQKEYERLLLGEPYTKVRAMNKTTFERGMEQGLEKGLAHGRMAGLQEAVQTLLEKKFVPVPAHVQKRLQTFSRERLIELLAAIPTSSSLKELGLED